MTDVYMMVGFGLLGICSASSAFRHIGKVMLLILNLPMIPV
ncbi:MAG: hypothetical protein JWP55_1637 [Mycobacterium sp.]|jgi:hypothetical protein|nr:hypothetical protein [Mycobacterium sp.]